MDDKACFIVRFHVDAYPDDAQYMLTYATSEAVALAQVAFAYARKGVNIRPEEVFLDPVQWTVNKRKYKNPVRVRSGLRRDAR